MRRCFVLLGLCGCDALFGLDSLEPPAISDAPADSPAPRVTVTGQMTRRWLYQDAAGSPLLEDLAPPATPPVSVRLADNTTPPMTWDPNTGTFTFESGEGERYRVIVDSSIGAVEYQLATTSLSFDDVWLGHPTQVAPQTGASIDWTSSNTMLPASELKFATTGVWSNSNPATTATLGKFTVPWPTAAFYGGQKPAVLSQAGHDSLFILHYTQTTGAPTTRILDQVASIGMVNTSSTTATAFATPLSNVSRVYCADMYFTHARDQARLTQLYPDFTMGQGGDTRLFATPFPDAVGVRTTYELALAFTSGDSHVALNYGNPFGLDVLTLDNAYLTRTPQTGPVLGVNIEYVDVVPPSAACTRHDNPPAPIVAMLPKLGPATLRDDLVLASDGETPIELSWTFDPAGTSTVTQVALFKGTVAVRNYFTLDNHVFIDPHDLESDAPYRINIVPVVGGLPNAASGDFRTRSYPYALGLYQSGFFSIAK